MNKILKGMKGDKFAQMFQKKEKFIDKYRIGMLIGKGSYGEVRVCQSIQSKARRAVRILKKKLMDEEVLS